MEKVLKSPFVRIDKSKSTVEILETEPSTWWSDFALKNVTLKFNENVLEIEGEKIEWGFSFEKQWVEEMKDFPNEKYIKFGYKSIMDFFNSIKKPYVNSGWVKLEKTTPYKCSMNKWFVVL